MPRTVVAALAVAGALALTGFGSCGGTPAPVVNPFACHASFRGAVNEDLWCFAGSFDYTTLPGAPIPQWALDIPLYRGPLAVMEGAGGVGMFVTGTPLVGVTYGWDGVRAPTVDSGGALRVQGMVPPAYAGVTTHVMDVPLSWPGTGTGTLAVTFSYVPGPTDFLGAHGVVNATLEPVAGSGYTLPVTLHVDF